MPGGNDVALPFRGDLGGFTLIEALTAMALLSLVVVVLVSAVRTTSDAFRRSNQQVESFQGARAAFDEMIRTIGQATLDTRLEYDNPSNPQSFRRNSFLQFVLGEGLAGPQIITTTHSIFFVAPLSIDDDLSVSRVGGLLSAWGYFIEYGSDERFRPELQALPERNRFRLVRLTGRVRELSIFQTSGATDFSWFQDDLQTRAFPIADNIVALIIWPRDSQKDDPEGDDLAASYAWNSRANATDTPQPITAHQMPPLLDVTLVAISETSASLLESDGQLRSAIEDALDGLFDEQPSEQTYAADIETLKSRLQQNSPPIEYRIFRDTILLRENRWSST